MDWISANFHRSFGCDPVYPQIFPQYGAVDAGARLATEACDWLRDLDREIIGPAQDFLCGERITIADYLGAAYVCAGEALGCSFATYPNIGRWLANMRCLKSWPSVFGTPDLIRRLPCDGAAAQL